MSRIWLAAPLRSHAGGLKELDLDGGTARGVLQNLIARHPALQEYLYDEEGRLRPFVNVFINDQDIRNLKGENTPIGERDLLKIFPSISGGLSGLGDSRLSLTRR